MLSGDSGTLRAEESLTEEDKANGFILICCRAARTDLQLDLEDLGMLVDYPAKIIPCLIDSKVFW